MTEAVLHCRRRRRWSGRWRTLPRRAPSASQAPDSTGACLDGRHSYEITFAPRQEPPVNGFWSLTLYNEHHFFHPNDLKRYSLGTKNKSLKRNADGSFVLYAGMKSPSKENESNWLPAPNGHFSLYIRAYWGNQAILDGSWQPPKIVKTN
jgi:hypothetical protein